MTDRRWRPDVTESPSTGSGGQSSVLCPDGLPVYRAMLRPHNAVKQSSPFIDTYIPALLSQTEGKSWLKSFATDCPPHGDALQTRNE